MAMKIRKINTFKDRVTVNRPGEGVATTRPETFVGEFKHMNSSDFEQMLEQMRSGEMSNGEVIDKVLVGVEEVNGEDNQPVSFEDAREYIKSDVAIAGATIQKFVEALHGAKAKNSKGSRGG